MKAELILLREQLREMYWLSAKAMLLRQRNYFYEQVSKCGRGLARALRRRPARTYVSHTITKEGKRHSKSEYIAETFRQFYENLYNLDKGDQVHESLSVRLDRMNAFLQESGMPGGRGYAMAE